MVKFLIMATLKNLISIALIAILLGIFAASKIKPTKESFKIIKVISGEEFYIDLNKNNIANNNELFRLNYVKSFPIKYSSNAGKLVSKFNLNIFEILSLGYGAEEFSRTNLEGKTITFEENLENKSKYRYAKIFLDGKDYSKILLESGYGFSYCPDKFNYYKKFENPNKIKENSKKLIKLNIMVYDIQNKVFHKINCPNTLKIETQKLTPLKNLPKEAKKCPYCNVLNHEDFIKDKPIIIENPVPNISVGEIQLFLINPNNYEFPTSRCRTNVCGVLLRNINSAKTSIDFAVYGFDRQDEIFNALKMAQNRGVKIRGVVDSNPKMVFAYGDSGKFLKQFSLITDSKSGLMHNKFFIFDDKKVFTGTINISRSGTGGYNSNTAVIIENTGLAAYYKEELEQMLQGKFQKAKLKNAPKEIILKDGTKLKIAFSPKGDIYINLVKPLIEGAKSEILLSVFYLTHKDIVQDLINAKARGVKIKVIIDATSATNKSSKHQILRNASIPTKVENWGGKNHEKNIVVDGKIFLIGSANFSKSGVSSNDENVIVIENPKIASAYRNHFLKLYSSIDEKYLNTNPSAEGFNSKNSCYDGIDNDFDGKIDAKDSACERKILH